MSWTHRRRWPRAWVAVVALVPLLALGCRIGLAPPGSPREPAGGQEPGTPSARGPAGGPGPGAGAVNPLTGLPAAPEALQRRVLLVVVDNNPRARPQYGLAAADLVYELPVEGGITRFVALYLAGEAAQVGPVRSARHDMLDLVLEWDAVWVHAGESPQHAQRLQGLDVANLDDVRGAHGGGVFWRGRDRRPPHNLYTSTERVRAKVAALGWERPAPQRRPFRFLGPGDEPPGEPAREAAIPLPGALREVVSWIYDHGSGRYLRYVDGRAHRDGASGRTLAAANVLIQFVPVRPIPGDREGRLQVPLTGRGPLLVLSGGRARQGRWEKQDPRSPTRYLEEGGEVLALRPGPTWIMVVPERTGIEVRAGP